ncbi:ERF family protein [Deinococcus altitudinis]|uniref:ERF family protein n=1 Tax=Deinococcus altitudinis TaxID=468914 RepID=UPI0038928DEC
MTAAEHLTLTPPPGTLQGETYARSEGFTKITSALVAAQLTFPGVPMRGQANVKTRSGSGYSYRYATLHDLLSAVRPQLNAQGIWLSQPLAFGATVQVTTLLQHISGEWVSVTVAAPVDSEDGRMKAVQGMASVSTYLRRYGLTALLGIAADEDTDANEGGETPKRGRPAQQVVAPNAELIGSVKELWNHAKRLQLDAQLEGMEKQFSGWRGDSGKAAALRRDLQALIDKKSEPEIKEAGPQATESRGRTTPHQAIVFHLEGRYSFPPDQRPERLAFTAWLARFPGELTSTTQLDPAQTQLVLKKLGAERLPQRLIDEWRTWQQEQHEGEADLLQTQQEIQGRREAFDPSAELGPLPF